MPSHAVNFRFAGLTLLLLPAGWLLRELEGPLATPVPASAEQWAALAGQGGLPVMLGGLRSVAAGGFWLRANLAWERRDPRATRMLIEATVAADERPAYFWLNGARMLAYDFPSWAPADIPESVRANIVQAESARAIAFLEQGLRWHGPDALLYVELGNIHLRQRGDLEHAARCYRLAAEHPGAPYYAARIHAELLLKLGRTREALAWLQGVLPTLPADDPEARREVVLARIKDLERQVAVP
jgi:tetratricopeptide (TPR) repeat protein